MNKFIETNQPLTIEQTETRLGFKDQFTIDKTVETVMKL